MSHSVLVLCMIVVSMGSDVGSFRTRLKAGRDRMDWNSDWLFCHSKWRKVRKSGWWGFLL